MSKSVVQQYLCKALANHALPRFLHGTSIETIELVLTNGVFPTKQSHFANEFFVVVNESSEMPDSMIYYAQVNAIKHLIFKTIEMPKSDYPETLNQILSDLITGTSDIGRILSLYGDEYISRETLLKVVMEIKRIKDDQDVKGIVLGFDSSLADKYKLGSPDFGGQVVVAVDNPISYEFIKFIKPLGEYERKRLNELLHCSNEF